jgi:hypothetical protein
MCDGSIMPFRSLYSKQVVSLLYYSHCDTKQRERGYIRKNSFCLWGASILIITTLSLTTLRIMSLRKTLKCIKMTLGIKCHYGE